MYYVTKWYNWKTANEMKLNGYWTIYLKRKLIILSITILVFRSCIETLFYINVKKKNIEDLPHQFSSEISLHFQNPGLQPYLDCKWMLEIQTRHWVWKYFKKDQNVISFVDILQTQSNSPLPPLLHEEPVNQVEVRERRIQYFGNQSATAVDVDGTNKNLTINKMIRHFRLFQFCIFQIN